MPIPSDHAAPVVRLADPVADAVASAHDDAARILDVPTWATPPAVDAGGATVAVETLLAALSTTCGELGAVNRMLAEGVRDAARGLGSADDDVAGTFRHAAAGVAGVAP